MKRKANRLPMLLTALLLTCGLLSVPALAAPGDVVINATNFPDANFRAFVREGYDANGDGILSQAEMAAATTMDCSDRGIASLTGIKYFTELEKLNANDNSLTYLDMSGNKKLKRLSCNRNALTALSVSSNEKLKELFCSDNELTSLNVSANTALTHLVCNDNRLTSLDVSHNTKLFQFECNNNQLTSLDVSNNPEIVSLKCGGNRLASLDVTNNPELCWLNCTDNELTSLDLRQNTELFNLRCEGNRLTSLDVSRAPKLCDLVLNGNRNEYHSPQGYDYYHYSHPHPDYYFRILSVDKTVNINTTLRYDIWVQGRRITGENMNDVWGNGAISLAPASGGAPATLTLDNARIAGAAGHFSNTQDNFGIEAYEPFELELVGENVVISGSARRTSMAVYCTGDLSVSGSGKLTAVSGTAGSGNSFGIRANGNLTFNNGQISASAGEAASGYFSAGVYAGNNLVINGGSVYMGGPVTGAGYGAYASGSTIVKGGKVTASGGTRAYLRDPDLSGYADADVLVNIAASYNGRRPWNGTDPLGGSGSSFKYVYIEPAVYYNLWVQGRRVTYLNRTDVLGDGGSVAFDHTESKLTLTDANITGAAVPSWPNDNDGIYSEINLTLELVGNNTITAASATEESYGILVLNKKLTVTGDGSLTVTAGVADYNSCAIGASTMTMESGTVTATAGKGTSESCAVYSNGFTMEGGTLTATGGESADSLGIDGSFAITGGTVTAIGNTRGFGRAPDLSAYASPGVTVNTSPTASGATAWNGMAALGGGGTRFKYVLIQPSATILVGDVNGDGSVTGVDAVLLNRCLAGWSVSIDLNAADVNRDGSVTGTDAVLLRRYLAGWAGYESYIIEVPAAP